MSDRLLDLPDHRWHKNPDCDLHGAVDIITALARDHPPQETHIIDVHRVPGTYLYSVALDAGIGESPNQFPEITVRRDRVQLAVDLFAESVSQDVVAPE